MCMYCPVLAKLCSTPVACPAFLRLSDRQYINRGQFRENRAEFDRVAKELRGELVAMAVYGE